MKTFQQQFSECHDSGFCEETRFMSFDENPDLLPMFPTKTVFEKIKSGELKGISTVLCGKFGGDCHSKNENCIKMRNV